MSLQQLPPKKRVLFLIELVAEMVTHSAEDERLKKLIKVERIKRKLVPEPPVDLSPIGKSVVFDQEFQKSKPIKPARQIFYKKKPPAKIHDAFKKNSPKTIKHSLMGHQTRPNEEIITDLNKIINDKNVQMIECPGPGRNILVKVRNNVNLTKLILNETEIKNVIVYFSDYARIPIVGGILKTSIESMMISAVISDYAGSRFIINKRNPYDLIQGM